MMLVSAECQVPKLIAVKLFLRNSNACDHNPPTSQTDGRTERQLIMAIPRYATLRAVTKLCVRVTDSSDKCNGKVGIL